MSRLHANPAVVYNDLSTFQRDWDEWIFEEFQDLNAYSNFSWAVALGDAPSTTALRGTGQVTIKIPRKSQNNPLAVEHACDIHYSFGSSLADASLTPRNEIPYGSRSSIALDFKFYVQGLKSSVYHMTGEEFLYTGDSKLVSDLIGAGDMRQWIGHQALSMFWDKLPDEILIAYKQELLFRFVKGRRLRPAFHEAHLHRRDKALEYHEDLLWVPIAPDRSKLFLKPGSGIGLDIIGNGELELNALVKGRDPTEVREQLSQAASLSRVMKYLQDE